MGMSGGVDSSYLLHPAVFAAEIPTLGVCVGMRVMAKASEEGKKEGLGWFDTKVIKIDSTKSAAIPHMGWNRVRQMKSLSSVEGVNQDSEFYFLHSYAFEADCDGLVASASYSHDIGVVVQKKTWCF